MPLTDALLLDPAPFNVWIAARTDGIKGCGTTPGDPFDRAPAGPVGNGGKIIAFRLSSAQDTLVEGNLIGIVDPNVMHYVKSRNVSGFNNLTPAGAPVPLTEDTSGFGATFEPRSTLDDKIGDALLFSLL